MIEAKDLAKRYGDTLAVDDLSFTVHPGWQPGSWAPAGRGNRPRCGSLRGWMPRTAGTSPSTAVLSTTCPGFCTRSG